jgi:hypothetical protein
MKKKIVFKCFDDYLKYYFPKRYEEERRRKLTTAERAKEDVHLVFEKIKSTLDSILKEK